MADNVQIRDANSLVVDVAADDVGGIQHSRVKRSVGPDGSATDYLDLAYRSDTYTSTASGITVDVSSQGMLIFGLQVVGTGVAATAWNVVLEGSIDGAKFRTILTHTEASQSDGDWVASGAIAAPMRYFRSRCISVTLGAATNIVAHIIGK